MMRGWRPWREPLVHFVVLGALLFGLDAWRASGRDDPYRITLDTAAEKDMRELFRGATGREPGEQDMQVLRARWIDNEVLYREGLALRVDQGDAAIRERVIFKAFKLIEARLALPPIDEAGLRRWFEQHRASYDEPARFDYLEAVLPGQTGPDAARQFVDALNAGKQVDADGGLRVFKARPRENLLISYGEAFTAALEAGPPGQWRALDSREGLRIIRLDRIAPGARSAYEDVSGKVYQDWKDLTMQELRTAAVRELGRKYVVGRADQQP